MRKTAFIYNDLLAGFDYGTSHPLKPFRLKLAFELMKAYGLLSLPNTRYVEASMAADADLLQFHTREYIEILREANSGALPPGARDFGLGPGDNPVFRGVFDWSRLVTGATLQATALVDAGEVDIAFNISGGLHHAMGSGASGFCYINDPVVAIWSLVRKGRRIAYIDIDAHHGDGVQDAFYTTDRVLTISIHETGLMLFPGTGFPDESGEGTGEGYAVNVPLPPFADDELFVYAFTSVVPPLIEAFRPDIVVSQLGVDSLRTDPLAHLSITTNGFCAVVEEIRALSPKWVALGGGGYDIANVARAWTLAWAIMNNREIADEIPADFLSQYASYGFLNARMHDDAYHEHGHRKEQLREQVERVIQAVHENIFPLVRRRV